jgi:exosortase/archaeosortase family protein
MKSKSTLQFIFLVTLTYALGVMSYDFWLLPKTNLDEYLIQFLVQMSEPILRSLGYLVLPHGEGWINTIRIQGSNGVWISSNCDGFALIWVFTAVLIFLPGKWFGKLIYLILGGLIIEVFNVLRIVSLAMVEHHYPQSLAFNHDYTFTVLVYSVVVGLWFFWLKKAQFIGQHE